jgi:mannosyltransferase OCH1-like enzyme
LIPRIFHQVWLGEEAFPAEYRRRQATWLANHPGWELRFWTEENLPGPGELRRGEVLELLRTPWERTDVFRLELLWRYGGLLVDADLECLRSIEPLIGDASFVATKSKRGGIDDALLGATAGHPILDRALSEIEPRQYHGYDKEATGTRFLGRLLADEPGVTYIQRALIRPDGPRQLASAYSVGGSPNWEAVDRLWQSLLKADKRLGAARKEAAYWRQIAATAQTAPENDAPGSPGDEDRAAVGPEPAALKIPRVFHQVWVGGSPLPAEYVGYQQTWLAQHPHWQLRLWTDDNMPEPLRRPEGAERLRSPGERCDFLRLEVVWRFGGVYIDTDLECHASIETLIEDADFFTATIGSDRVDSSFFGAVAGHPILDRALDQIPARTKHGFKKTKTGPRFVGRVLAESRENVVRLTPPTVKSYTTHHKHRTYFDLDALRFDILKIKLALLEVIPSSSKGGSWW